MPDAAALRRQLDACLVGDEDAMKLELTAWQHLPDPFPEWRRAEAS